MVRIHGLSLQKNEITCFWSTVQWNIQSCIQICHNFNIIRPTLVILVRTEAQNCHLPGVPIPRIPETKEIEIERRIPQHASHKGFPGFFGEVTGSGAPYWAYYGNCSLPLLNEYSFHGPQGFKRFLEVGPWKALVGWPQWTLQGKPKWF